MYLDKICGDSRFTARTHFYCIFQQDLLRYTIETYYFCCVIRGNDFTIHNGIRNMFLSRIFLSNNFLENWTINLTKNGNENNKVAYSKAPGQWGPNLVLLFTTPFLFMDVLPCRTIFVLFFFFLRSLVGRICASHFGSNKKKLNFSCENQHAATTF